jgi:hypothetical protein
MIARTSIDFVLDFTDISYYQQIFFLLCIDTIIFNLINIRKDKKKSSFSLFMNDFLFLFLENKINDKINRNNRQYQYSDQVNFLHKH